MRPAALPLLGPASSPWSCFRAYGRLGSDELEAELNGMCEEDMDDQLAELDSFDALPVRAAHARPDLPGS